MFPILLILLLPTISSAEIPLGSTLTPSNPATNWTSPNGTFSLTFIPASSPSSFSAAITYFNNSVWKAGGDAASVDSSGRLELLRNGNLRLVSSSGGVVWESRTSNQGVTTAELEDSGNLVLRNGSTTVWSSFQNPTDTILPDQIFTPDNTLQSGAYSFRLLANGNITLRWNRDTIYWNQGLNSSFDGNLSSPSLRFQANGILLLNDPTLTPSYNMVYSSEYPEPNDGLSFVRLDSDGNLRIYSFNRAGLGTRRWVAVSDQCRVYWWCGNMGICSYRDTTPVCSCPSQNFVFVNPNDPTKGCRRTEEIANCPARAAMVELDHAQILTYQSESASQYNFAGNSACSGNFLTGQSWVAATSFADGSGQCYLTASNFVSAYQSPSLPGKTFIKVCGPVLSNPSPSNVNTSDSDNLPAWVIAVVVVGTLLSLILLESVLWFWCCRNNTKFGGLSAQYALLEYASGAPVQFSYKDLQRSTRGFKDKLGAGGFGTVYKGVLANKSVVAVKQLEGIEQGEKQFRMEVATISSTHHLNLVRLIGFCSEGRHRLLVYEYMKNGSLDDFLFQKGNPSEKWLNWETRFSVALGTARGITYLHEECRDCIVHCDIKPENILLDENFNAKVSDFGLAKLINSKDQRYRTLTSVRGTRGYLAPEWLANHPITAKSDVFSYGMVLLELVSGRRNFEVSAGTNTKKFSVWAAEELEKGNISSIVDKRLMEREVDMEQVERAIKVSFWCIHEQPSQRPSMGKVVQMLEGITTIEKPPVPKAFTESVGGGISNGNISRSISVFSTSAPAPSSSSSSIQPRTASSLSLSGRDMRTSLSMV